MTSILRCLGHRSALCADTLIRALAPTQFFLFACRHKPRQNQYLRGISGGWHVPVWTCCMEQVLGQVLQCLRRLALEEKAQSSSNMHDRVSFHLILLSLRGPVWRQVDVPGAQQCESCPLEDMLAFHPHLP